MKKKLLIALLAIMAAVCCAFGVTACDDEKEPESSDGNQNTEQGGDIEKVSGSEGLEYTLSDDGTYYYFSGLGTCTDTEITIANFYNDKPVKQIGKYVFTTDEERVEIGLDSEVDFMSLLLFSGSNVERVMISEGITAIGAYAFSDYEESGCLKCIFIPDSITVISACAFFACNGLTSISIPDSVMRIGFSAFSACYGLETIEVTSGNSVYHSKGNCLIETATKTLISGCNNSVIPTDGSVTCIGNGAFYHCTGLTSITIPVSVTGIGGVAFQNCISLTNINYIGTKEQWNYIEKNAYWNLNTGNYIIHCTDGDISK